MVEFGLVFPILLLFIIFAIDLGIYVLAFLAVENGARAAVLRNSSGKESASDRVAACRIVTAALEGLPSAGAASSDCSTNPITVASAYCDTSVACPGLSSTPDGGPASVVTVNYQVPPLFRLPFTDTLVISRTAQMRIGGR